MNLLETYLQRIKDDAREAINMWDYAENSDYSENVSANYPMLEEYSKDVPKLVEIISYLLIRYEEVCGEEKREGHYLGTIEDIESMISQGEKP